MEIEAEIEVLIKKFGEEHRKLIDDSVRWMREQEPIWGVKNTNAEDYVYDLLLKVVKKNYVQMASTNIGTV